ncbi:hypothetical protein ES703_41094 [subsurface metagenome]
MVVLNAFPEAEEADTNAIVVVEAMIDGCRNPTYWLPTTPGQKMGNLSVAMVGMLPGQQTNQAKEAIIEQVAP